jgi:hypothetical protein
MFAEFNDRQKAIGQKILITLRVKSGKKPPQNTLPLTVNVGGFLFSAMTEEINFIWGIYWNR